MVLSDLTREMKTRCGETGDDFMRILQIQKSKELFRFVPRYLLGKKEREEMEGFALSTIHKIWSQSKPFHMLAFIK